MKKRVLAMFLSTCMSLSLLPATALAASPQAADTFFYAFNAPNGDVQLEIRASDDETVVELGEVTDSIQLTQAQMDDYKAEGEVVYLRAVPDEGYGFSGWTGMLSWSMSPNPFCVTNLNRDNVYYLTATFQPLVTVTFDAGDHGRLAEGEAASDTVVSNYWYDRLDFPQLVVDDGYRFTGWRNSADNEVYTSASEVPASWDGAVFTAQYEEVSYQIEEIDVTIGAGLAEEMPNLMKCDILHAEYGGEYILLSGYNGHFTTPWISDYWHGIPDSLTSQVDTPAEAQDFFGGFTAMKTIPFWSTWKGWLDGGKIVDAYVSGTTLYLTLDNPAPAVQKINVSMNLAEGSWANATLKDFTLTSDQPDAVQEIPAVQAPAGKEFVGWKLAGADAPMDGLVFSFNGLKELAQWNENEAELAFEAVYEDVCQRYLFNVVCDGQVVDFTPCQCPQGTVFETEEDLGAFIVIQDPFYYNGSAYRYTGFTQDGTNIYLNYEKEITDVRYLFNVVCDGQVVDFTFCQCPQGTVFETEEDLGAFIVIQDPFYYNGSAYRYTGFTQDGTNVYLNYEI